MNKRAKRFQAQKGEMHLRQDIVMENAAVLGTKELHIYDTTAEQACNSLHGFVIAKCVQNSLTTGVGKVHIFIGKGSPILAWTKIERRDKTKFVINRQYPADHRLPIDSHTYTGGSPIAWTY